MHPASDQGDFDLGDALAQLSFVSMPDGLGGISHFRLLNRMWSTFDGMVLVASQVCQTCAYAFVPCTSIRHTHAHPNMYA